MYIMKAMLDRITHPSAVKKKLNQKDRDKFTPLHYAARYNHFEMCELLMQKGACKYKTELVYCPSIL